MEDLWLTENQPARTYKKFLLVRTEGKRQVERNIDHYNLDMIIAIGYRAQSQIATRFRRWVTWRLHEYIQDPRRRSMRLLKRLREVWGIE